MATQLHVVKLVYDNFGKHGLGRYRKMVWISSIQLVTWDFDNRPLPGAGDVIFYYQGWTDFRFDPLKTDWEPHKSFCRGELPPAVYADYLEEMNVPLPAVIFDCLRGWNSE